MKSNLLETLLNTTSYALQCMIVEQLDAKLKSGDLSDEGEAGVVAILREIKTGGKFFRQPYMADFPTID